MMVLTASGSKYEVSQEVGMRLAQEIKRGTKYVTIQGNLVAANSIMEIRKDDELPMGKWRCQKGHIHPKEDTYCNLPDLGTQNQLEAKTGRTPEEEEAEFERQRAYMEKIRKNLAARKKWDE